MTPQSALIVLDALPQGGADPHGWRIEQITKGVLDTEADVSIVVCGPLDEHQLIFGVKATSIGNDLESWWQSDSVQYDLIILMCGGNAHRFSSLAKTYRPGAIVVVDSSTLLTFQRPVMPDSETPENEREGQVTVTELRTQRDAELLHRANFVWVVSQKEASRIQQIDTDVLFLYTGPPDFRGIPADRKIPTALVSPHREFGEPDLAAVKLLQEQIAPALEPTFGLTRVLTERTFKPWENDATNIEVIERRGSLTEELRTSSVLVVARPYGPTAWAQFCAGRSVGIPMVATHESAKMVDDPLSWGIELSTVDQLAVTIRRVLTLRRPKIMPSIQETGLSKALSVLGLKPRGLVSEKWDWIDSDANSRRRNTGMQSYRRSIDDALVDPEPNPGTDVKNRPLISIITPVYDPSIHVLKETIESVLSQQYENWQLCLINDCSDDPEVDACCRKYASQEPRITYVARKLNGGIAAASNSGLDVAEGEFVALLDHDDLLRADALIEVVRAINKFPDLDMTYSDEDKLFADGTYDHSYAKSGWSPDLRLSYNYVCHFAVFRRTLLQQLNGWNLGFDGAQDYDLSLRFSEITDRIVHIPRNLYHWRVVPGSTAGGIGEKSNAWSAGKRALESALARRSVDGSVNEGIDPGTYHVSYMTKNTQRVGIIIPTRDRHELISACVDGINNTTSWDNIETLVINNESTDKATLEWMDSHAGPVIDFPHQFSYARMMNLAAEQVDADLLLFLNCDITIIEPNWISAMVGHIQERRVGAVGARLAFPDGQVQHEGIAVGVGGVAVNVSSRGYFSIGNLVRNCYALTGACLMVRPEVFWEAGGFEERLRVAFNDVDLTMRIHQLGYDLVYTPHASLLHQESALRGSLHPMEDENFFIERWGQPSTYDDPYYNPRLSRHAQYYFADDVKQVWLPRGHPLA